MNFHTDISFCFVHIKFHITIPKSSSPFIIPSILLVPKLSLLSTFLTYVSCMHAHMYVYIYIGTYKIKLRLCKLDKSHICLFDQLVLLNMMIFTSVHFPADVNISSIFIMLNKTIMHNSFHSSVGRCLGWFLPQLSCCGKGIINMNTQVSLLCSDLDFSGGNYYTF